jgi:hypothetical protein
MKRILTLLIENKMAKLSKAELAKREELIQSMKKNKRNLVKKYGSDAEKVLYGRATNLAKKLAEQDMEQNKLREMVKAALMQPVSEKKSFPDLTGDGKVTKADILKARGVELDEALNQAVVLTDEDHDRLMKNGSVAVNVGGETVIVALKNFDVDLEDADYESPELEEDIDLGHVDNEPHMIKAELYRIGKYAMELYAMLEELEETGGEYDFPAWWQAKITTAMNNMVSSKHYLDFELKEPEIDAAVDAMTGEEPHMGEPQVMTVDLVGDEDEIEEIGMFHDPKGYKKSEPNPKDLVYTKEYKGNGVYDILKNGEKIKTVDGEGNANAYINKLKRELEEGLPKGYFKKATAELDESFEKLVGKLKKQGKSEKAAKAIAGAVANYKAKGGGKGPTTKQKAK